MIHVENGNLKMTGNLAEVSAECVMALRAIYKKNLDIQAEPEIAKGIIVNMVVKAMTIEEKNKNEEVVLDKE